MTNITQTPAYRVAFSMYVALGGDKTRIFDSVEAIYAEIDTFYGKGSRITTEALTLEITENRAELYNDDAITGYKPVSINVNVPQKYTDEQVEELKETSRQQGYNTGYDLGVADGFTQGEAEGYSDGYAEGLDDGAEEQKGLLEEITIRDNGVYEKEDGYKKVTVDIEVGILEEELNAMLEEARNEGIETGVTTQKAKLTSTTITENGTYTREDGWNSVTVKVSGAGGDDDALPKIYNGFVLNSAGTSSTAYATDISQIDFSKYDWSNVYDMSYFFQNFGANTYFTDEDFANFDENFNGKIMSCGYMFNPSAGSNGALQSIPAFLNNRMHDCYNTSYMFTNLKSLKYTSNMSNWDTSNVVNMSYMFNNCTNLISVPLINTSNVVNMSYMFSGCSMLTSVPQFDTSNVVDMSYMFSGCSLSTFPSFDFSSVKNTQQMFSNSKLTVVPTLNLPNAVDISSMFYGNKTLTEIGDVHIPKCKSFKGSYSSYIAGCTALTKIGVIDCDSINNASGILGITSNLTSLIEVGGFKNLGKQPSLSGTTSSSDTGCAPNLSKQSVINILNSIYDRASAGYSVLTLKLHANNIALLSDDEIAIATNKGWIIA